MTFDPNLPHKCVDGVNINLTAQEIADDAALQAAWAAEAAVASPPVPDLATQIANALIAKGTLTADDLNPDTLATVNKSLAASGLAAIVATSQGLKA